MKLHLLVPLIFLCDHFFLQPHVLCMVYCDKFLLHQTYIFPILWRITLWDAWMTLAWFIGIFPLSWFSHNYCNNNNVPYSHRDMILLFFCYLKLFRIIKQCLFIDFSTYRFKENSFSCKIALWLIIVRFETGTKKMWVGTSPNSKPKNKKNVCA